MNDAGGEAVVSRIVQVVNRRGLHARAAAKLVNLAEQFSANIDVVRDGQTVSARSIMGLMMLGAGMGSSLELRAEGFDAAEALEAIGGRRPTPNRARRPPAARSGVSPGSPSVTVSPSAGSTPPASRSSKSSAAPSARRMRRPSSRGWRPRSKNPAGSWPSCAPG
jgi:phosphocarrier protein